MTVESYIHQGRHWVTRAAMDDRVRRAGRVAAYAGAGFLLSAASLAQHPQPLAMALTSAMTGWRAGIMALGAMAGYGIFWAGAGDPGLIWAGLAGLAALALGKSKWVREAPLILPALCALIVAATGLGFQLLGADIPTGIYLFQVALAFLSSWLFTRAGKKRDPVLTWALEGIGVLALAQVGPLGYLAAAALAVGESFPGAALAGVALDLSQTAPVPMTAVICGVCVTRLVPGIPDWGRKLMPGAVYLAVMALGNSWEPSALPWLILGGFCAALLPRKTQVSRRRGDTGLAQVRLDMTAETLAQTRQLLMEVPEPPLDEEGLLQKCRERACGGCPNRRSCSAPRTIPRELLRRPLVENTVLPFPCKKPGRMILELRRTQEQHRILRADRERRREYRAAVSQQYDFLSEYLRSLSEQLARRGEKVAQRYAPEVSCATRSLEADNGDRFRHFSGPGGRYYLLLCDGMGTGCGAAQEGRTALELLHRMLCAGFPAEQALQSLNSILVLGGRSGAVTVDLAELRLDTGAAALYKWGAAPSYLLKDRTTEKLGTAGPPPGIGLTDIRGKALRLSLRGGETLILCSDGVDGEEARRCACVAPEATTGELAEKLLAIGGAESADDATVVVARLHPENLLT